MGRTSEAREQLIQSAICLMHTRGYTAVGVQEVCDHAGVNKGSFYHFFASKRDLVLAALDAQWEATERYFLDPAFATDRPLLEKFQRLLHMNGKRAGQEPMKGCFFGNLSLELSTQDEVVRQKLQDIFQQWAAYFERELAKAVASGELPEIDPRTTAQTILAYIEGIALLAKTYNNPALIERLTQRLDQLIIPPVYDKVKQLS